MRQKQSRKGAVDKPVSLSPLSLEEALRGLLQIPNPEATKPSVRRKRQAAMKSKSLPPG